jgi:ribonuclease BN (tRNA processing enzyme)
MIEAMTEGGFKKRGVVFCPDDAIREDSIILKYARNFPAKIEIVRGKHVYRVGDIEFQTSMRHLHTVETYGLKFKFGRTRFAILTDTRYFKELAGFYKADILVISVVFFHPRPGIDHLSLVDVEKIIKAAKPKKAIITHFGVSMLKANPRLQAKLLTKNTGIEVEAAYDGMILNL